MSGQRSKSAHGRATTTSWIDLDETDEQWGNEALGLSEPTDCIDGNEQEIILREHLEELEGRPSTGYDHLRGLAGQHLGETFSRGLSRTIGLYPYSTAFAAYFPGLTTKTRPTASPLAPRSLASPISKRRESHVPPSAARIPNPSPSIAPPSSPVQDSTTKLINKVLILRDTQDFEKVSEEQASCQDGQRRAISKSTILMGEQLLGIAQKTPRSNQTASYSNNNPFQPYSESASSTTHQNSSTIKHEETAENNKADEDDTDEDTSIENIAQAASGSSISAIPSSQPHPTAPLSLFVVPHGFGTTRPLGIDPSPEYPCGDPRRITRKGFSSKETMIDCRNRMLEANIECRKNGVFFGPDGQLRRMASIGQRKSSLATEHGQTPHVSPDAPINSHTTSPDCGPGNDSSRTAAQSPAVLTSAIHTPQNGLQMSPSSEMTSRSTANTNRMSQQLPRLSQEFSNTSGMVRMAPQTAQSPSSESVRGYNCWIESTQEERGGGTGYQTDKNEADESVRQLIQDNMQSGETKRKNGMREQGVPTEGEAEQQQRERAKRSRPPDPQT
ncbi:hypothetical protein DL98DRAFT_529813 [Cadophora sp. DSE1049]|nr:hypothetical protein DL98DRAFT_529813 [Cadophora sp. DSE1049]